MPYKILIDKQASKFIRKLNKEQQSKILSAIKNLPFSGDTKKLSGYDNFFRLRVGTFRVIYSIKQNILLVEVIAIGNRGDIYKHI